MDPIKKDFAIECKKLVDSGICNGSCCGPVEIPNIVYQESKNIVQGNPEKVINITDSPDQSKIIMCSDLKCAFLDRKNNDCLIYHKRPKVCQNYGTNPELPCPHLKPNGNRRSKAMKKRVERQINQKINEVLKNAKSD